MAASGGTRLSNIAEQYWHVPHEDSEVPEDKGLFLTPT